MIGGFLAFLLTVCLTVGGATSIDVPFTRQDEKACGAASIWMVMEYWKQAPLPPEEIHRGLYSEEAGGVFAAEMEQYLAGQGFQTFSFAGQWSDLVENTSNGRPVIVCLRANSRGTPLHYVVVTGADENAVLVNDPARGRRVSVARAEFERQWERIGRWTLLAVPRNPAPITRAPAVLTSSLNLEDATGAFRSGDYPLARRLTFEEIRKAPGDPLGNDFLGTLFFLENNLEAALKYWNKVEKPRLRQVPETLETKIARGNVLRVNDYLLLRKRIDASRAYSRYTVDLEPAEADDFDLNFRALDRPSWEFLSWLRGLPYQSVYPQLANVGGSGIHIDSLFRWDDERRRTFVGLSGPVGESLRYKVSFDARDDDTWPMRKNEIAVGLQQIATAKWAWSTGFVAGPSIKYDGGMSYEWWRAPERKLALSSALHGQVGKTRADSRRFARLEADTWFSWGVAQWRLRGGRVLGDAPHDEMFAVGLDRDHDLWIRAHDTRLIGRRYVVLNSEVERKVADWGFVGLKVAPFVDVARVGGSFVDTGLDVRVSVASFATFSLSIGRDLNEGRTVFFTNITR